MHRSFVRWRRGGRRRPPCGRNSKGLVLFDAAFGSARPDGFQSSLCQGLIPTSGVNKWSPSLSHLDPQLLPEGGDLPHPITTQLPPLGSCFPFFLSKPHCHLGAVLSPQSKGLAVCQTHPPTSGRFLHYLLQSAWAGPFLLAAGCSERLVASSPPSFDTWASPFQFL